jgi:hypothetical protein
MRRWCQRWLPLSDKSVEIIGGQVIAMRLKYF